MKFLKFDNGSSLNLEKVTFMEESGDYTKVYFEDQENMTIIPVSYTKIQAILQKIAKNQYDYSEVIKVATEKKPKHKAIKLAKLLEFKKKDK